MQKNCKVLFFFVYKYMSALKKWNKKKRGIKKMVEKIIELAKENLSIDGEITATSSFKEDLEVDSLDLMELVMALEDEFNVEIPSEELQNIKTVQDVADYLTSKGVEA